MTDDGVDRVVRRAIGGDDRAVAWIEAQTDAATDPEVLVVGALLTDEPARLDQALAVASTSRERQLIAIARAHLDGQRDLVDALARDHLVDHPDGYVVAWIASMSDRNR